LAQLVRLDSPNEVQQVDQVPVVELVCCRIILQLGNERLEANLGQTITITDRPVVADNDDQFALDLLLFRLLDDPQPVVGPFPVQLSALVLGDDFVVADLQFVGEFVWE
jgi:hypothetical protein